MEDSLKNILNKWDIRYDSITKVQDDVWSIDDSYILKAVDNKDLVKNLQIFKKLRANGIPAPEIVSTVSGEDYTQHDNMCYFLMYKMKGRHFDAEEVLNNPQKARLIGKTIAKLHKAFTAMTDEIRLTEMSLVAELKGWIQSSLKNNVPDGFTYNVFNACVGELDMVYDKLKRHIIHRDMHLGNLLFENDLISGYIDFDLTQVNVRVFDLAYILSGWIVEKVGDENYLVKWKLAVRSVIEGYQQEQELSQLEIKSIITMMCCIEILFVAYFMNTNDRVNSVKAEECLKWLWLNRDNIIN